MAFRQLRNETTRWVVFLERSGRSLRCLATIERSFANPSAFENLLQNGDSQLDRLSQLEWMHLTSIVDRYSDTWQTWFTDDMYPALTRQRKKRDWTPNEPPVTEEDFEDAYMLLHLWAPWNENSRLFDASVSVIAKRYAKRITVRSFNVDWPLFREHISDSDRSQGPSHIYTNRNKRWRTGFGTPSEGELASQIDEWLSMAPRDGR